MFGKIVLIMFFILASPCFAAENALRNIHQAPAPEAQESVPDFKPGATIIMPDDSREVIEKQLPEGNWRTGQGSVISPLGIIMEGRYKDDEVRVSRSSIHFTRNSTIIMPDGTVEILEKQLADGNWRTNLGRIISQDGLVLEGPDKGKRVTLAGEDQRLAEGARVNLPDGSVAKIVDTFPNGNLRAQNGSILSPEGKILEGPDKGSKVTVNTSPPEKNKAEGDENKGQTAGKSSEPAAAAAGTGGEEDISIADILPTTPYGTSGKTPSGKMVATAEGNGKSSGAGSGKGDGAGAGKAGGTGAGSGKGDGAGAGSGKGAGMGKGEGAGKGGGKGEGAGSGAGAGMGAGSGKGVGKGAGAGSGKGEGAGSGKGAAAGAGKGAAEGAGAGSGKGTARARPGDPLRIPEEAVNTGNLSFLEGCWQGTRPEYFTKRTIKECFCFNANGRTGKRRVYDITQGSRMCIGATKANLSRKGVLSVTSSGASCNDGERWGAARMVCRNSGPRTPCSWVFTDANNGTQAYEIPFVRVQSCGR